MSWLSKSPFWKRFVAEVIRAAIAAMAGAVAATQLPIDEPQAPPMEQNAE